MLYSVTTTANARKDIQNAIDWENKREGGLGGRFLDGLEQKFSVLSHSPYIGRI